MHSFLNTFIQFNQLFRLEISWCIPDHNKILSYFELLLNDSTIANAACKKIIGVSHAFFLRQPHFLGCKWMKYRFWP